MLPKRVFKHVWEHFFEIQTEVKQFMANDKIIAQKQAVVAQLKEKLQNAVTGVLVDYSGINVSDDTALRNTLREAGVEYGVVKNTLTRFAVKEAGLDDLSEVLSGTTCLLYTSHGGKRRFVFSTPRKPGAGGAAAARWAANAV